MGRELKQNAVQNNPVFLGEVRLDSSQQLDLPDAQVSLCWFEPVRYLNTAPASPNGFHRIGKRQEHDVAQNRSFTDGKFCCQMRNSRVLRLAYDKIVAECPNPEDTPELTKTLVRQRVDRVLVSKRQEDGSQEVQVLLNDPKKRKRRFALSLFGEL